MAAGDEPKIRITGTPNPNAAKFVVERAIFDEEGRSYFEPPPPARIASPSGSSRCGAFGRCSWRTTSSR